MALDTKVLIRKRKEGVFDAFLKEKLVNIRYAYRGLVSSVKLTVLADAGGPPQVYVVFDQSCGLACLISALRAAVWRQLRAFCGVLVQIVVSAIQALVFAIVLCPLAALYMVGLYFSAAVSLWRLIEHYIIVTDASADAVDPSKANLKPALDVLYSLALAQGVLFCYKTIFSFSEKKIIKHVSDEYKFSNLARDPLLDYLEDTRIGCEKDVAFAGGKNLIVYAVELMESKSPDKYISGTRILDALISLQKPSWWSNYTRLLEQHRLMKQLLTGKIIDKLVQTLTLRGPYDRQTRVCSARILAHVAGEIHLDELPRGMQCIGSLLVTFQEYKTMETYERDWQLDRHGNLKNKEPTDKDSGYTYKVLVLLGLKIVEKFFFADEDNCRAMNRDTDGGVPTMIMAPVSYNGFHDDHHEE
uniref:DUF4220 domain-containing protein n=1 Tax=Leersia perrieri TaxID=77586 RepID=A0A0D9Y048_9ORYZ